MTYSFVGFPSLCSCIYNSLMLLLLNLYEPLLLPSVVKLVLVYFLELICIVLIFFFIFDDVQLSYRIFFTFQQVREKRGIECNFCKTKEARVLFAKDRDTYVTFLKPQGIHI